MDSEFVWNAYGNVLRFGRITETKEEGGWKFHKVNWTNDEAYEAHTEWLHSLRPNENYEKEWYRVDEVHYFDPKGVMESMLHI
jgi:hypothetical protein